MTTEKTEPSKPDFWHKALVLPVMALFSLGVVMGFVIWPFARGILLAFDAADDFWGFDRSGRKFR